MKSNVLGVLGTLLSLTMLTTFSSTSFGAEGATLLRVEKLVSDEVLQDLKVKMESFTEEEKKAWAPALNQLATTRKLYALPTNPEPNPPVSSSENKGDEEVLLAKMEVINKIVDQFIVLGNKLFTLVKKGEPQRYIQTDTLKALPFEDRGDWVSVLKTQSWQAPKAQHYRVQYENLFGVTVVDFTFSVGMSYGGNHQGKGKYLTGVYVATDNLLLRWGFNFNAESSLVAVTNLGTSEDPVAAMTLSLTYDVFNVLNSDLSTDRFMVAGDGQIKYLGP